MTYNLIVISRLRDERGEEERGNDLDGKMRGQSPRASPSNGHSPVLNLSKSGNEQSSVDAPSERSELHSPNPSIHEDEDDNLSDGNVSEVDEQNDKDDDGSYKFLCLSYRAAAWLVTYYNQFNQTQIDFDISFACSSCLCFLLLSDGFGAGSQFVSALFESFIISRTLFNRETPIYTHLESRDRLANSFKNYKLLIYDCM